MSTDPNAEERDALRAENEDLREALRKKESEEDDEEEKQLRLMERSYQMASKYLPKGGELPAKAFLRAEERSIVEPDAESALQEPRMEVLAEPKHMVSSLAQPMADSTFMQEYGSKERHLGFHSALAQPLPSSATTLPGGGRSYDDTTGGKLCGLAPLRVRPYRRATYPATELADSSS